MSTSRLRHALRAIRARAYVRIVGANREISWLLGEVLLPIVALAAYIFIYRSLGAPSRYEAIVVLGGAMIPFWLGVLWSMASQFYWEKEMGNLDLYMASPMEPVWLLLGMALGGMFMSTVRAAGVLVFGVLIFGVDFTVRQPLLLAVIFVLTLTALFSMGMAASSVYFMVGRVGIKLNMILMEPVYFLSGLFFPVNKFGKVLLTLAALLPLTVGLDGVRQLMIPDAKGIGFLAPPVEAAILLVMTIVFTIGAMKLMKALEIKGKHDGTMTLRWQ
ncbi:MAG: ABC transporter permease [Candidatus Lernaella stagnicola]|nr:ABC transporter permease [Candidatus Lernaella stagnicola]